MLTNILAYILFFIVIIALQLAAVTILDGILHLYVSFVNYITYKLSNFRGKDEEN